MILLLILYINIGCSDINARKNRNCCFLLDGRRVFTTGTFVPVSEQAKSVPFDKIEQKRGNSSCDQSYINHKIIPIKRTKLCAECIIEKKPDKFVIYSHELNKKVFCIFQIHRKNKQKFAYFEEKPYFLTYRNIKNSLKHSCNQCHMKNDLEQKRIINLFPKYSIKGKCLKSCSQNKTIDYTEIDISLFNLINNKDVSKKLDSKMMLSIRRTEKEIEKMNENLKMNNIDKLKVKNIELYLREKYTICVKK